MKQEQRRSKPKADILVSARTGTIQFCGLTKTENNVLPCVTFMVHRGKKKLFVCKCLSQDQSMIQLKSREIHPDIFIAEGCGIFLEKLHTLMNWSAELDYRMTGVYDYYYPYPFGWMFDLTPAEGILPAIPGDILQHRHMPPEWSERMGYR